MAQADAAEADLVVMACRGADAVASACWAATERVVRHPPCPVLVVWAPGTGGGIFPLHFYRSGTTFL